MARPGRSILDVRGHGSVALGLMLGNVLGYLLALAAARRLGPSGFGELSALLALVIVLAVLPTGLQTVVARASAEGGTHELLRLSRSRLALLAGGIGGLAVIPMVVVGQAVHASLLGCVLVALTVAPLVVLGWHQGLSQGQERLGRLAALLVLNNGGRALGALGGIVVWRSAAGALAGGLVVAVAVAAFASGETPRITQDLAPRLGWASIVEVARASAALLALFLCTGVDVVLARVVLSAEDAGIYAAGAVVAKVAFWLPQFAAVTALPRLVDPGRRSAALRVSILVVCVSSSVIVLGCLVARSLVVEVVGGAPYAALRGTLPWFAVLGALWALSQIFLFDALARRVRRPAAWLWVALVALVGVVLGTGSQTVTAVVLAACACAAGAVAAYAITAARVPSAQAASGD